MTNALVTRRRFLHMVAKGGAAAGVGGLASVLARPSFAQATIRGQEILHWSFLSPEGKSVREVAMREIEAKFAERTGAKVTFQVFPWHELKTKLIAAVQAGNPPDNSRVDAIAMPMVVKANALTNLDPYIKRDIADRDDYLMDFKPTALFSGSKYGMLIETAARGLMIRKDILQKAGVKPPPQLGRVRRGRPSCYGCRAVGLYVRRQQGAARPDRLRLPIAHSRARRPHSPGRRHRRFQR